MEMNTWKISLNGGIFSMDKRPSFGKLSTKNLFYR